MVPTDHDIPLSRTFEVHFQGVFKDFSLFFQTSICEKMINIGLFTEDIQRPFDLEFAKKKMVWGDKVYVYVFNFLDDLLYYGYNTDSNTFA